MDILDPGGDIGGIFEGKFWSSKWPIRSRWVMHLI